MPLRALRDQRLTARHFRLLAIIAAHDQLDKNGAGCWASQRRLAALAGVQELRLSHTLSDLRDFGYIASAIHATNRHRRIHRIIYDERDKNWDRGSRDTCPPGQVSDLPSRSSSEGRYLTKTEPELDQIEEKLGPSESNSNDLSLGTYVRTYKKDKKDKIREFK